MKPDEDSGLTTQMSDIFGGKIENRKMYIKRLDNAGGVWWANLKFNLTGCSTTTTQATPLSTGSVTQSPFSGVDIQDISINNPFPYWHGGLDKVIRMPDIDIKSGRQFILATVARYDPNAYDFQKKEYLQVKILKILEIIG